MKQTFESLSQAETEEIGKTLAARLEVPAVVLLKGPLGAGKTTLVRGLAQECGVDSRVVHSPSFSLVNHYPGAPDVVHVDLYRLETVHQLHTIGLEELLEANALVMIEWADKLPWELPAAWTVTIEVSGDAQRRLIIEPPAGRHRNRG